MCEGIFFNEMLFHTLSCQKVPARFLAVKLLRSMELAGI